MDTIKIKGEMEIDVKRGVIYFHSEEKGHSAFRMCGLPTPIPDPSEYGNGLDITVTQLDVRKRPTSDGRLISFSWRGK